MNRGRLVFGMVLLVLGGLFLAQAADLLEAGPLIATWWPLVFVVFALLALFDRPPNYTGAIVLTVISVVLLNGTADLWSEAWAGVLWSLLLIGGGLWVLANARHVRRPGPVPVDALQATAVFSGREIATSADPFRGGVALAVFGGVDIDLRAATLPAEGALIDATAVFGGVGITVPPGWRVVMSGPAIFGGTENHAEALGPPAADAPVLTIRAIALFGGIEVKAKAPSQQPAEHMSGAR